MIGLNIAIILEDNYDYFKKINDNIEDNYINFDNNNIPHLTLIQLFCEESNINNLKNELKKISLNILEDLKLNYKCIKQNNYYMYQFQIKSINLMNLQKKIIKQISKYITIPSKDEQDLFCEDIYYNKLFDLVNNFTINEYTPHITLGISNKFTNMDINNLIVKNNKLEIKLFKIGDYGTAKPLIDSFFFGHRINTINELTNISNNYGIELDLRDNLNDELILVHDPFKSGENFEDFLKKYNKSSIILNVKSERIEYKIINLLKKYNVNNYFFLDCSFPMIYQLNKFGEKNIAVRFSEYESIESVILVKNMVKWVWIDCFNKFPLDKKSYNLIKNAGLKICIVSPELQGHDINRISEFRNYILDNNFEIDAICTKYYNIKKWI